MKRRVYQFGLLSPTSGEELVRGQLRAAHEYRNDLVAIERGRRSALRTVDDTPAVEEAVAAVNEASRSGRKAAVAKLRGARHAVREASAEELARIAGLDADLRRDARALTPCFWGTYLDIEAAHNQARATPLYGDDAITPSDPRFVRGPRLGREAFPASDPRATWWLGHGQVGIQLQGGLTTAKALEGVDRRVRLEMRPQRANDKRSFPRYGVLHLRVGSDGREPVWASWPLKMHRALPEGVIKWVRVSVRREGLREKWTVEITIDLTSTLRPRELDTSLEGALAIEWEWSPLPEGGVRVARWADDRQRTGEIVLSRYIAEGLQKANGIRSVRDVLFNDAKVKIQESVQAHQGSLPLWLLSEAATMHLWKSPDRMRGLAARWRRERLDAARDAYELVDAWEAREGHLYEYEVGQRHSALRARRDAYRVEAARLARAYRTLLVSDQDLSREARWGDDSDVRFLAGVSELRQALRNAFGDDAIDTRWRDAPEESDERTWCERSRDAWVAGGARGDGRFAEAKEKVANAWAKRKAKRAKTEAVSATAREPASKTAG